MEIKTHPAVQPENRGRKIILIDASGLDYLGLRSIRLRHIGDILNLAHRHHEAIEKVSNFVMGSIGNTCATC